jgi:hypothetical protein
MHYFSGSCGTGIESAKSVPGHVTSNLCFYIRWYLQSRSALQCLHDAKCGRTIVHARVQLVRFPYKARRDKLRRTCVFASGGIFWSRSAFRCIWGAKHRCTLFHPHVGLVQISQKARRDTLLRTYVLHPIGSMDHVVHCGVSRS